MSGKSSAAATASEITGLGIRNKVLTINNPVLAELGKVKALFPLGSVERSLAFLDAIEWDIDNFSDSVTVLQESTMLVKSFAIDSAKGSSAQVLSRYEELLLRHPKFMGAVVLTASTESRLARLSKRQTLAPDTVTENDMRLVNDVAAFTKTDGIMQAIMRDAFDATIVDTSAMTQQEVADLVIDEINQKIEAQSEGV